MRITGIFAKNLVAASIFLLTAYWGEPAFNAVFFVAFAIPIFNSYASIPLLFYSGMLKNAPIVNGLPVDFTLIATAMVILFYVAHYISANRLKSDRLPIALVILAMFLATAVFVFVSPATFAFMSNSGLMLLFLYIPLTFIIVNSPDTINLDRLVDSFISITFLLGFAWIGMAFHNKLNGIEIFSLNFNERIYYLSAFGETYMIFSGFTIILALTVFIRIIVLKDSVVINSLILFFLLYCIINSPARGLSLGLAVTMVILSIRFMSAAALVRLSFIIGLGFVAFIIYSRMIDEEFFTAHLNRILDFSASGDSVKGRFAFLRAGFEAWINSFGLGVGTDGIAFINGGAGEHAHNFILEILLEYGIFGSIPFYLFIAFACFCCHRVFTVGATRYDRSCIWLSCVFIILIIFAFFSGTLGQMRQQWIVFALVIWAAYVKTQQHEVSSAHS